MHSFREFTSLPAKTYVPIFGEFSGPNTGCQPERDAVRCTDRTIMKSSTIATNYWGSGPKHMSFRCYVANPKPSEAPEGKAGECDDEQRENG